jgi:hypothetical protein
VLLEALPTLAAITYSTSWSTGVAYMSSTAVAREGELNLTLATLAEASIANLATEVNVS